MHKSDESQLKAQEERGRQNHGMQPNHDNQTQLMTKAIAGVRKG